MQKIALVFPGQGSQTVGMLAEFSVLYPVVQETFATASDVLGYDLWQLCQNGPEENLNQTEKAQPALLAAGVAMWRVWQQEKGMVPELLAGHSLGEYTALVCANALDFSTAIALVAQRGRIMQDAVPVGKGAMAAIVGLTEEQVLSICQEASQGEVLQPANYNSPGQIVIAGAAAAVQRAIELAQTQKAKMVKMLAVSIPSHCALMKEAALNLQEKLNSISMATPKIPVIHNADVEVYSDTDKIKNALVRQLYSPVRWVESVKYMQNHGVQGIFECGPGKVLMGLNKRIVNGIVLDIFGSPSNLQNVLKLVRGS